MKQKRTMVLMAVLFMATVITGCRVGGVGSKGDVGQFIMDTSGGSGGADGGSGGGGGYVSLYTSYSSGADIEVLKVGEADATFPVANPAGNLGDNPLIISSPTTFSTTSTEPVTGTAYLYTDGYFYIANGDGAGNVDSEVTGLRNNSTLTLPGNIDINMDRDFINNGSVTTTEVATATPGYINLYCASFINRGTIALQGTASGGSGGDFYVYADYAVYNNGPINTYGANNADGNAGDGGSIDLMSAEYVVQNTAKLDSHGGTATGTSGFGGAAGYIYLESSEDDGGASCFNSGHLAAYGGAGVSGGGNGNSVEMFTGEIGDAINSGRIDTFGGDSSEGNGGDGSYVEIECQGGSVISNAHISTYGGSTTSLTGNGGTGGNIDFDVDDYGDPDYITPEETYNEDLQVSGNLITRGGSASSDLSATGSGGSGGYIYAYQSNDYHPLYQKHQMLGYGRIVTNGGDGNSGGEAGYVDMYHGDYGENNDTYFDCGGVVNRADIEAKGGNGIIGSTTTSATGGDGNDIEFYSYETYRYYLVTEPENALRRMMIDNSGNIDTSGGDSIDSTSSYGHAGYIYMWSHDGVQNSGNLTARGGDDNGTKVDGTAGYGGDGSSVTLWGERVSVDNTGVIDVSGGYGAYRGGDAGYDDAYETNYYGVLLANIDKVNTPGAIIGNGGNANPAVAGSMGGDGSRVEIWTESGVAGLTYGSVTADAGTGETDGLRNDIIIGGLLVQDEDPIPAP
jgi:hypothetical protein